MNTMTNKYPGKCNGCGKYIRQHEGILERSGSKWIVWCQDCYDRSDHSSYEDRECGDRAYEDRCAQACGYNGSYEASRGDYEGACLARAEYEGGLI